MSLGEIIKSRKKTYLINTLILIFIICILSAWIYFSSGIIKETAPTIYGTLDPINIEGNEITFEVIDLHISDDILASSPGYMEVYVSYNYNISDYDYQYIDFNNDGIWSNGDHFRFILLIADNNINDDIIGVYIEPGGYWGELLGYYDPNEIL